MKLRNLYVIMQESYIGLIIQEFVLRRTQGHKKLRRQREYKVDVRISDRQNEV